MKTALVLSGGGARAAYQVGVLKAVCRLLPAQQASPFTIMCGTSSGALNSTRLACHAENFSGSVHALELLWSELQSCQVHRSSYLELSASVLTLLVSFFRHGKPGGRPLSLLDNTPLRQMLEAHIDLHRLELMVSEKYLDALCISALGYASGQNLSFFQGGDDVEPWSANKRQGIRCKISLDHVMASMALPTIFPAVRINREYFGDGALRQTAPLSAALHLGAERMFVIGVAGGAGCRPEREKVEHSPSLAQVMGQLINSAFIDSLGEDMIMLKRFNAFADCLTDFQRRQLNIKPVKLLVIEPTVKFDQLAAHFTRYLPSSIRTLLSITGAKSSGSNLASYILFEKEYCRELIRIGYADAMNQAEAILDFFGGREKQNDSDQDNGMTLLRHGSRLSGS
jgi:NTE family protein